MISGLINFLKPPGMTSHDVVSFIRRTYGLKKVGHAGTLDPAAAGVLPVALGQATRLLEYMTDTNKTYRVELTFGYETDTGDEAGQIIQTSTVRPKKAAMEACLSTFVGTIEQVPPMYSAIKVDGKKLYDLARQGISIDVKARQIMIESIELLTTTENKILFDVTCSKGTYIRTLCLDISHRLGTYGTMTFLLRTQVGDFRIDQAATAEEIQKEPDKWLLPIEYAVRSLPRMHVNCEQSDHFLHGRSFSTLLTHGEIYSVFDEQESLLGIGKVADSGLIISPVKVIAVS
ncbi:tRNA pseudouridine55 synthase [Sporomusaceae bacterium BoRhaA]|uniref:tRNA pseudouridine(55) synthase TruB n=1 Tax=Pelorhabdus rhamnosifermentans TaxID=2772457 RepID=UPI001C062731|nr:tRNA pseudouridine(55) synthase TruB [Pelorhabdus rhamnosifermentans]MBU2701962.1 tRNA pseudouridine55 synthase [Pelorhabdus rhamnosifermentans]